LDVLRRTTAHCSLFVLTTLLAVGQVVALQPDDPQAVLSQDELQRLALEAATPAVASPDPNSNLNGGLNFLSLLLQGGSLMIPIGVISLLVVAMSIERFLALRRGKLFPSRLKRGIEMMLEAPKSIDPQEVYQLALRSPSTASRVIETMLQKVGRPIAEIEQATSEACQRETERLYNNVRWLTLAAAVTPLIGLLGTVWGMIIAFYNTTQIGPGKNKAEFLAEGIYIALVTTLGGLAVAIPAAIFAHYFEGRITSTIGRIEEQLKRLIPRFERFEGKVRYDLQLQGLVARDRSVISDSRIDGSDRPSRPIPPPAKPPVSRS
jgi:biopolymer transport protein ExbB